MRKFNFSFTPLLLCLFNILVFFSLSASLIDPNLIKPRPAGWKNFNKGRQLYEKGKFEDAEGFFFQALETCRKPPCGCIDDFVYPGEQSEYEINRDPDEEVKCAIYRHSHFYLGLICLKFYEFSKARFHFEAAIDLNGKNVNLRSLKQLNIIDPIWIVCAGLSCLAENSLELAFQFAEHADLISSMLDEILISEDMWDDQGLNEIGEDIYSKNQSSMYVPIHSFFSLVYLAQSKFSKALECSKWAFYFQEEVERRWLFFHQTEKLSYSLLLRKSTLYLNQGCLNTEMHNFQEALNDFTKSIESDPLRADAYLHRAFVNFKLHDYAKAIDDFSQAIELDSKNANCFRQRALAYLLDNQFEKANSDLEFAYFLEEQQSLEEMDLGIQTFSDGEYREAYEWFNLFIEDHPSCAVGYQNQGATLLKLGDYELALDCFNNALRFSPKDGYLYELRGQAYLALSCFDLAEADFLMAANLNPQSMSAYLSLGALYFAMERWDDALKMNQKALEHNQSFPTIHSNYAFIHFKKGNYQKALDHCLKAIQLGASQPQLYLISGLCQSNKGQYKEAIENYQKAIELGHTNSNTYFNLGEAWYRLGKLDEAFQSFSEALVLDPIHADTYRFRGLVSLNLHHPAEAYADFYSFLRLMTQNSDENMMDKITCNSGDCHLTSTTIPRLDDDFMKGIVNGLREISPDILLEVGPFLINLVFKTTIIKEELESGITQLMVEIGEREWNTIVPELKELYLPIKDPDRYQKGYLAGKFIAKYGRDALSRMYIKKGITELKEFHLLSQIQMRNCLKMIKHNIPRTDYTEPPKSNGIPVYPDDCWIIPFSRGKLIGTEFYPDHALARIAPKSCNEVYASLESQIKQAQEADGVSFLKKFQSYRKTALGKKLIGLEGKKIPPFIDEIFIANPTGRGIKVIVDIANDVIEIVNYP